MAHVDGSPDFVAFYDRRSRRACYINPIGRSMLGLGESDESSRQEFADLHPAWVAEMVFGRILPSLAESGARNWQGEAALLTRDGSEVPASMILAVHPSPAGGGGMFSLTLRDLGDQKQADDAGSPKLDHQLLFESSRDALMLLAPPSWKFTNANAATVKLFGAGDVAEFTSLGPWNVSPPHQPDGRPSSEKAQEMIARAMRFGSHFFEWEHCRLDGQAFMADVLLTRIEIGKTRFLQATVRDISQRKRAEEMVLVMNQTLEKRVMERTAELRCMMDNLPYMTWLKDVNGQFMAVNKALADYYGAGEVGQVIGKTDWDFNPPELAEKYTAGDLEVMSSRRQRHFEDTVEVSGQTRWMEIFKTPVIDTQDKLLGIVGFARDITERKKIENELRSAEEKIRELAYYDTLTQLPNRRLLLDRLQRALVVCARTRSKGALCFVDLDNFKTLNDTFGHDKGDLLLQEVARRIQSCVRAVDTASRFGGDEFVVLLEGLGEQAELAAQHAKQIGDKIIETMRQPFGLAGGEFHSSLSIGITLFDEGSKNIEDLLKQADIAMYQAKSAGRNTSRFFNPELQLSLKARALLEDQLRQAIRERQFILHCQPQVADGRLIGAEALVRWSHPERGLVAPADFIPLAEETGLILQLGLWVLEEACRHLAAWKPYLEGIEFCLAVNVSARQFHHPDFVTEIFSVLYRTGADPRHLKLELTESMLLQDVEDVVTKMYLLKERGVTFSLDDFGTGYSSLSYLKRLPLGQLKIDRTFVRDVLTDANDAAIVRTVITLGHSLGLEVIAEGVETEAQLDFLAAHGCHAFQGYLIGHPMPVQALEGMLRKR